MICNFFLIFTFINSIIFSIQDNQISLDSHDNNDDIPILCKINCLTSFGSVLGQFKKAVSYSNCNDNYCINNRTEGGNYISKDLLGSSEDIYTGMKWQCVEYARRFLVLEKRVTFESVDSAFQIFDIQYVKDINSNNSYLFESYLNGNNTPPEVDDLIIFPKTNQSPFGHVAVITKVDFNLGFIGVGEQNINRIWEDETNYSRLLIITKEKEEYIISDIEYNSQEINTNKSNKDSVLGWKRIKKSKLDL